jgi:hypothetical protein
MDGTRVKIRPWDYLIVTASNEQQAEAYQMQLSIRRELGLLGDVNEVLVVADPGGQRIGSGGSTLYCLMEVLSQRLRCRSAHSKETLRPSRNLMTGGRSADANRRLGESNPAVWEQVLGNLRILIVHAGGDSRRLPAYSACGKLFMPMPGANDTFKTPADEGAVFCGIPLLAWLEKVGAKRDDVWNVDTERKNRTIGSARLFPAVQRHDEYRQWMWMLDLSHACEHHCQAWRAAPRYSLEQILVLANHKGFYRRRSAVRARLVRSSLAQAFRLDSGLSA